MKRVLLGLFGLLLLSWVFLAVVGVEPQDRRPGTRLGGEVVPLPDDWSFINSDVAMEVHLETYPWFGVPFSVTTVIAHDDGRLFVPSLYPEPMAFPGSKFWNKVVDRNPNIRLRVADSLYEMAIYPITDEAGFEVAFQALAKKYPFWAQQVEARETRPKFALLEVRPRSN